MGWRMGLVLALLLAMVAAPARAQDCGKEAFARTIDGWAGELRRLNAEGQPRLRARLKRLAELKGWAEADAEEKGYGLLEDEETRGLDAQGNDLLLQIDKLGDDTLGVKRTCADLETLRTATRQMLEVTTAKAAHISAKLDAMLKPAGLATAAPATLPVPPPQPAPQPPAAPSAPIVRLEPPPAAKAPAPPPPAVSGPWSTETRPDSETASVALAAPPPAPSAAELEFTVEDIRATGHGFFGSLSSGLASVIEHAFQRFGRPSGYILGSEGGGAFLAGLRYGEGKLVMKDRGETKVYWQGPSIGYDFGAAGSRVLFLVYGIREPGDVFARFAGVDGSAFAVGGIGLTVLSQRHIVLAPIRAGIGLRLGASVGYVKLTDKPTWNPL